MGLLYVQCNCPASICQCRDAVFNNFFPVIQYLKFEVYVKKLEQQFLDLQAENEALRWEIAGLNMAYENLVKFQSGEMKGQYFFLDYPLHAKPRYGYGLPPHSKINRLLQKQSKQFKKQLENIVSFKENLLAIPLRADNETDPSWINPYIAPIDTSALYAFVAHHKPKRYLEVGSGNSTKFVRRAITDHRLKTQIISIDPQPRETIDNLCDQCLRQSVEDVDPSFFDILKKGDILFIDGTHRVSQNSDVTALMLDVIPNLAPGVIVHIHDIFWPYDYPGDWVDKYFSEQYILGAYLIAEWPRLKILLANTYISLDKTLSAILDPLWDEMQLPPFVWTKLQLQPQQGSSFWFQITSD